MIKITLPEGGTIATPVNGENFDVKIGNQRIVRGPNVICVMPEPNLEGEVMVYTIEAGQVTIGSEGNLLVIDPERES